LILGRALQVSSSFLDIVQLVGSHKKQKVVALSSYEVEYIAAATAACQGIWLARLLGDPKKTADEVVGIKVDNKSAFDLIKNSVFHERSKHIQTRFHFIRESSENGEIRLEFINIGGQLTDILTKALPKARFQELRAKIGMCSVGAQV
jgi:hypothetical protein